MIQGADVIREVEAVFREEVLPAAAALMNNHCEECTETSCRFQDRSGTFMTWAQAAEERGTSVESSLLTSEAWRYYLPAMMIWAVRDMAWADVLIDYLVYQLTPPVGSDRVWFDTRSAGFSPAQRRAITAYLEWYNQQEEAEWAPYGDDPPGTAVAALEYWRAG